MRNTCVLWTKAVLGTLTLIAIAVAYWSDGAVSAQSADPLLLPRISFSDITYIGAFRLPRAAEGGEDFSYGGQHLAYNPARNSLFGSSLHNTVAEVTIPTPVNSADINQLPFASYIQPFNDPTEGHLFEVENGGPNPAVLAGLLVRGNRLYGTGSIYYDALDDQVVSHFARSTDLSTQSFSGWSQVWESGRAGYVGGYMANIPAEWQSRLGGPALTGQCCIPIASRTSYGPGAFGFDPAGIVRNGAVPASPLLYYTQDHATLGSWEGSNPVYGGTTAMGGVAVLAGTRTVLFIGRTGLGNFCYGHGVADPALAGTLAPDGVLNCYDPTTRDKGMHAFPYRFQMWAYDLADFVAVRAGTKNPWDVRPYGVWPFDLPYPEQRAVRIGGVAYDAQRQLLYIAQIRADLDGFAQRPIIHALKVNAAPAISQTPLVTLTPNAVAPQPTGKVIRWSASVSGPATTYEYRWSAHVNGSWTVLRDWSTAGTLDWQPATAAVDARVSVSVRSAAGTDTAEYPFPIFDSGDGVPSAPASSLKIAANLAAPQHAGTAIVWTATPIGGSGPMAYKWFVYELGLWKPVGSWSSSNQFTWRPTVASSDYRVSAWVKRASSTAEGGDAAAEQAFPITDPSGPNPRVASVALAVNKTAPQPAGTTVTFTATPTGGTGTLVYKWLVFNGAIWQAVGGWTPSNQFNWTPSTANSSYRVSVWVKRESSTLDEWEATAELAFPIGAGSGSTTSPTPTGPVTSTRVVSLALSTNVAAPQPAGTTIVWTATPSGGSASLVYKWFVFELGLWRQVGTWTASNQLTWTPTNASSDYRISAWVKNAATTADEAEATTERPFAITAGATAPAPAPAPTSARVSSLALGTNVPAPQPAGATVVWTATPTGGSATLVYKWFVFELGLWRQVGTWTASNQFSWTPTKASNDYRVSAWVKNAATTADEAEATAERPFAIATSTSTSSPAPPPSTSTRVSSLALNTNVPAPQPAGSTVVWTATPTGGSGTLVYKWFVFELGLWRQVGSWSASNQFSWTPTKASADYRISAWVKNAATTADEAEATSERPFAITASTSTSAPAPAPTTSTRVSSLALSTNLAAPQPAGSTIVWTATPAGGSGSLLYKWFVYELGLWRQVGSWTASNQFSWTPAKASADYRVSAWVKNAATAADEAEATTERPFAITASTSTSTPAPAPSTSTRVSSLALSTNVPSPQPAGSTVVWTATPSGGSGALVYKWFVYELGLWRQIGSWTASNQFSWTPAKAGADYRVSAWVKNAATTADEAEATTERPFAITASTAPSAPAPTTSTRVTGLALSTNVPAPQPAGTTIVWTATPTGGSGSLVYKWFVYELGLWRAVGSWTASNQLNWKPTNANADYRVSAWVKNAATAADEAEATAERPFAITASGTTTATSTSTPTSARVSSLALTTSLPAPQRVGSTVIWTATPTGGSGALVYKWFVYEMGQWRPVGSWTSSNQLSWTPAHADGSYRVSAWVKNAATAADEREASAELAFPINP
jgi:hypothetical protein